MQNEEINLEAVLNNMSSINSEDYWFTKVSKIKECDKNATLQKDKDRLHP